MHVVNFRQLLKEIQLELETVSDILQAFQEAIRDNDIEEESFAVAVGVDLPIGLFEAFTGEADPNTMGEALHTTTDAEERVVGS